MNSLPTDPLSGWRRHAAAVDGLGFAHWSRGTGAPLLLLHGVGPGTTGLANFSPVLDALAAEYAVHLIDLVGFGASARKTAPPFFDVALWLRQAAAVLAGIGAPAFVVGNSVGGALALKLAASEPGRVRSLLALGAPCAAFAMPPALRAFWAAPVDAASLARAMAPMTAAARPPPEILVAQRLAAFDAPGERAYFAAMTGGPPDGRMQLDQLVLSRSEADAIACPVTLVYGRQDRACPPDAILPAALALLAGADAVLLGGCGHNVAYERTAAVLGLIRARLVSPPVGEPT